MKCEAMTGSGVRCKRKATDVAAGGAHVCAWHRRTDERCLDYLNRLRLAEKFTCPTKPARPRFSAAEIHGWMAEGLVEHRSSFRLTAKGRALLEESGKMTRLPGETS